MILVTIIFAIISLLLTLFYAWLMSKYKTGWDNLEEYHLDDTTPITSISVIVPARNEADNIKFCIEALLRQTYPNHLLEIIVVDDFSTDKTAEIAASFKSVKLIKRSDEVIDHESSFKKGAIEAAIKQAGGELIVTTDADCVMPQNWLRYLESAYRNQQAVFIAAPVLFTNEESLFERFQALDFTGMMGITAAGIVQKDTPMCNGANLAYSREVFYEVDGFKGINHKASGDDMMLQQKIIKAYPNRIFYVKHLDASVLTTSQKTIKQFYNQRLRWASKNGDYQNKRITYHLIGVWLFSFSILLNGLLAILLTPVFLGIMLLQYAVKAIVDYRLLASTTSYFKNRHLLKAFWPSTVIHLIYIVSVGFLASFISKYDWKGRELE